MNVRLQKSEISNGRVIAISGSKSESNRALILQAIFPQLAIENRSNADDTRLLQNALDSTSELVDIHHAGTAMRFLTAYFAAQEGREVVLTGSERMQQRPIKVLVDALTELGADITYVKDEGFPPLKIIGKNLPHSEVSVDANISSQYISALVLMACQLGHELNITLKGQVTSLPYLKMTLSLLQHIGVPTEFSNNTIKIGQRSTQNIEPKTLIVESDWSSASYFYSIVALSPMGTEITLTTFKENSLQGDSDLVHIYHEFGVETVFNEGAITLKKIAHNDSPKTFNLVETPDLAQTIVVTCLGLNVNCELEGLHTLKIKETDRLLALKIELEKLGAEVQITENSLYLKAIDKPEQNTAISTYEDHRMAMAFAPLALKVPIQINDAQVVTKSYPDFWEDLVHLGFDLKQV